MTSFASPSLPGPSPSRANPFARPTASHSPRSFKRTSLLPSLASPVKVSEHLTTPGDKPTAGANTTHGSGSKARQGWRLLWRGGLEIGKDGWRLEGITFFAKLSFPPPTPSHQATNPFDAPEQGTTPLQTASPFTGLPAGDTDLCLSLESLRGRKYLKLRGVVDLPAEDILEGTDEAGVQMSIAPNAPLLAGYFTGLLCKSPSLSPQGRTLTAVAIGLGDDIDSPSSTVLVYGQKSDVDPTSLRLLIGRRRPPPPPPSERKVRPGDPLPRALFFPSHAPDKPPPPFPRARTARSLSRAPSTSSIYAPPPPPPPTHSVSAPQLTSSGRTPGRRGEKRMRTADDQKEDERKRRAGRIIAPTKSEPVLRSRKLEHDQPDDEDIFGKRGSSIGPMGKSDGAEPASDPVGNNRMRRVRVSQQVLDNKGVIRKQTMVLMEERGYLRTHPAFKDVFGMTTKGAYFAFRDLLETGPIMKVDVHRVIQGHLDMYLPSAVEAEPGALSQVREEEEDDVVFENPTNEAGALQETHAPSSEGLLSDGVFSEEPMSEGIVSEGAVSAVPM